MVHGKFFDVKSSSGPKTELNAGSRTVKVCVSMDRKDDRSANEAKCSYEEHSRQFEPSGKEGHNPALLSRMVSSIASSAIHHANFLSMGRVNC